MEGGGFLKVGCERRKKARRKGRLERKNLKPVEKKEGEEKWKPPPDYQMSPVTVLMKISTCSS